MGYVSGSFVFGQQPTAAQWNVLWSNDASFNDGTGIANIRFGSVTSVKNDYKFSVYRTAAFTGGNNTVITYDTKNFDTSTNIDVATNKGRFTAPIAGFYFFSAMFSATVGSGFPFGINLYKNGSLILGGNNWVSAVSSNLNQLQVNGLLQLAANDYIEVYNQANGVSFNVGATATWFTGFLVSAT